MNCPRCQSAATRVVDSRVVENGAAVRRRRLCKKCAERFTTFERLEMRLAVAVNDSGETLLADIAGSAGRHKMSRSGDHLLPQTAADHVSRRNDLVSDS